MHKPRQFLASREPLRLKVVCPGGVALAWTRHSALWIPQQIEWRKRSVFRMHRSKSHHKCTV